MSRPVASAYKWEVKGARNAPERLEGVDHLTAAVVATQMINELRAALKDWEVSRRENAEGTPKVRIESKIPATNVAK